MNITDYDLFILTISSLLLFFLSFYSKSINPKKWVLWLKNNKGIAIGVLFFTILFLLLSTMTNANELKYKNRATLGLDRPIDGYSMQCVKGYLGSNIRFERYLFYNFYSVYNHESCVFREDKNNGSLDKFGLSFQKNYRQYRFIIDLFMEKDKTKTSAITAEKQILKLEQYELGFFLQKQSNQTATYGLNIHWWF